MLEPLFDFRTGTKVELVIPVFNESFRLNRIINAYKNIVDIVLIDDNSTDNTIQLAEQFSITVFRRNRAAEVKLFAPTEFPIVFYVNNISLSGKCIKIDADELITSRNILEIIQDFDKYDVIYGRRIDVLGGVEFDIMNATYPVAYKKNSIICLNKLHAAIQPIENIKLNINKNYYPVYHLDLCVESDRFGKMGRYCKNELDRLRLNESFTKKYFRRFLIPIFTFTYRKIFKIKFKYFIYFLLKYIIDFLLSILIILNEKYFGDNDIQINISNDYFLNNFKSKN